MNVDQKEGSRERILIVDDDELNVEILEEILGEEYCLQRASDGTTALAEAIRFRPALVLLDVMMPGLNGYETARSMRDIPELRSAKIILVSAKAMVSDRLKGYDAGADDYITKPFDHDELLAKVRVFLRLRTAEETERLQAEFLGVLGHQFRTPLTHVMGAAEVLASGSELDPATRRRLVQSILGGAHRLSWLLDYLDHFHAFRIGSVASASNPVCLREAIDEAMGELASAAEVKQVGLSVEPTVDCTTICANRYDLCFVLRTLLGEAIAASPSGEMVRVAVTRDGSEAVLSVNDRRKPLDPAERERMFDLLWVRDIRHHGGDISCLPLARELTRRQGGDLQHACSENEGTTFLLRLPLPAAPRSGEEQPGSEGLERAA